MEKTEVIVIGGGIIGCCVARELAARGRRVVLLERTDIAAGASSAAAGILGVQSETDSEPLAHLGRESRALYCELLVRLQEETGQTVALSRCGAIRVALDDADAFVVEELLLRQEALGFTTQRLTAAEMFRRDPSISRGAVAGALCADDNCVDAAALTAALARAAERHGARIVRGENVRSTTCDGGRVSGVETDSSRWTAEVVVNAAGAWGASIEGGGSLPVQPVRGQIVVVDAGRRTPHHTIYGARGYAVPRRDGRVLFGSTLERVGFDVGVTAGGVAAILAAGIELLPDLGGAPVVGMWAGLRPASPDGLPIVGPHPEIPGYVLACGHYRNGILLAPVTARIVADTLDGIEHPLLGLCSPRRFTAV